MIAVEHLRDDQWQVTVTSRTTTHHKVKVTAADVERFTGGRATAEQLLLASFAFLLEREPNTSILGEFELPLISRYFPEYEQQIGSYLAD
jgi:hypothetical protein